MIRRYASRLSTRPASHGLCGLALVAALCSGGCTSAAQARATALDDADVLERELDTLFACAGTAVETQGMHVARQDAHSRVLQTAWTEDGTDRWRLTVLVRVHPRFGPGADAVVTRDTWVGDGLGELSGPTNPAGGDTDDGWVRTAGLPNDAQVARNTTDAVAGCWRSSSPLAPSGAGR